MDTAKHFIRKVLFRHWPLVTAGFLGGVFVLNSLVIFGISQYDKNYKTASLFNNPRYKIVFVKQNGDSTISRTAVLGTTENAHLSPWEILIAQFQELKRAFGFLDSETGYTLMELPSDFLAALNQKLQQILGPLAPKIPQRFTNSSKIVLHNARVNTDDGTLTVTYTQTSTDPSFITAANSNTILQGTDGFPGPGIKQTASRSTTTLLASLQPGVSIRLCTNDYATCSNKVSVVFMNTDPSKFDWKKSNDLALADHIQEAKKYFELTLSYDAERHPVILISDIRVLKGYAKAPEATGDYNVELYNKKGDTLAYYPFSIPKSIFEPPPEPGTDAVVVKPRNLKKLKFAYMVAFNEDTNSFGITDPKHHIISAAPVTNIKNITQFSEFQSLLGSEVVKSTNVLGAESGSKNLLDITFVGNNYGGDGNRFNTDVAKFTNHLFNFEPFASRSNQIIFHTIDNTLNLECLHDSELRRSISCNSLKVVQAVNNAGAPHDFTVVITNDPVYGGGTVGDQVFANNGQWGSQIFVHELGHALAQLADEYFIGSPPKTDRNCFFGTPPNAAWAGIVAPADYFRECSQRDWYRSSFDSIMRSITATYFNPVSQKFLNDAMNGYTGPVAAPSQPNTGFPGTGSQNPPAAHPPTTAPAANTGSTQPQSPSYSTYTAILNYPSAAVFGFAYTGPAAVHHVDMSASPTWTNVYKDFVTGLASPLTVTDPTKWGAYQCGYTVYWRIRQGDDFNHPTYVSPANLATITCPPSTTTPTYTDLSAQLYRGNAIFNFSYTGPLATHNIDVSIDPALGYYMSFARGATPPLSVIDPSKWPNYACGTRVYWRVRQGTDGNNPTFATPLQTATVNCTTVVTPTPAPSFSYSNFTADLSYPGPAVFTFAYNGPTVNHRIELSEDPAMHTSVFVPFGEGTSSPITVTNPAAKWASYTCGKYMYWRVRQGADLYSPTYQSIISKSYIGCPAPTLTPTPTATPAPQVSYSNLSASLTWPNPATFSFSYTGPPMNQYIDLSTTADFSSGVYISFGQVPYTGPPSPIVVNDPASRWAQYTCGRTLYWQIRSGGAYGSAPYVSQRRPATVTCPVTPTPTTPAAPSYSNYSATLMAPGNATFSFSYSGPQPSTHRVDLGLASDMVIGTYVNFASGPTSPIVETNTAKWSEYTCGKTMYWRMRQGDNPNSPTYLGPIQTTTVQCPTGTFSSITWDNAIQFNFSVSGAPGTVNHIDMATSADMNSGVYQDFGSGTSSPILVEDADRKWRPTYNCDRTFYWRVRQGDYNNPTYRGPIQSAYIECRLFNYYDPPYDMHANLQYPGPATFTFSYTGPAATHYVDVSDAWNDTLDIPAGSIYPAFGQSNGSPIVVNDPTKWSAYRTCGKVIYYRFRQGDFNNPTRTSLPVTGGICQSTFLRKLANVLGVGITNSPLQGAAPPTAYSLRDLFGDFSAAARHTFNTVFNIRELPKTTRNLTGQLSEAIKRYHSYRRIPLYNAFLKNKALAIAVEREKLLLSSLYADQKEIKENIFLAAVRNQAPPEVREHIEEVRDVTGIWRISYSEMYAPANRNEFHEVMETVIETADKQYYKIHQNASDQNIPNGAQVTVNGLVIGNEILPIGPVKIQETGEKTLGAMAEQKLEPAAPLAEGQVLGTRNDGLVINKKVYAIIFAPFVNGKKIWQNYGWNDPALLLTEIRDAINTHTNGRVSYSIVRQEEYPIFNQLKDGYTYNATTYETCRTNDAACRRYPNSNSYIGVDYQKILTDYRVCQKLNNGEIDELWLYGAPYFGYYEAITTGPKALWTNGPPEPNTAGCNRILHIMGFNYERDYDMALHSYGHRIEGTMSEVYRGWNDNPYAYKYPTTFVPTLSTNWDKFSLNNHVFTGFSYSGCGATHYPPNGGMRDGWGYDYGSANATSSTCDDYLNYPSLTGIKIPLSCATWSCNEYGYHPWWFSHIPSFDGTGLDGKSNNWWRYIADSDYIFSSRPSPTPIRTPTPVPGYTALGAILTYPGPAAFGFQFNGSGTATNYVDVSTSPTLSSNVFQGFASGLTSPVIVNDPKSKWPSYTCGITVYWRLRQGYYIYPSQKSTIQSTVIQCPTPTPRPSPTISASLSPTPTGSSTFQSVTLHSAALNTQYNTLTLIYSQTTNVTTYVAVPNGNENVIIQAVGGFNSTVSTTQDTYPTTSFLGTLTVGMPVRLCTANYQVCSNIVNITPYGPAATSTPSPAPTVTPTASGVYSGLNGLLQYPTLASFAFSYTGGAANHFIDLSTRPDMSIDVYVDFAQGTSSSTSPYTSISIYNPTKWSAFACGRTLYWRVRQGNFFTPTRLSPIKSTLITCSATPTPTPAAFITPTKTPTPTPTRAPSPTPTRPPTPTLTPTRIPTPTPTRIPTPTPTRLPTATPTVPGGASATPTLTPSNYWTNLTGTLRYPGPATFAWTYTGPAGTPYIDAATSSDLSQNFYPAFVTGSGSPTTLTNPTKWTLYTCGRDIYWRVRQGALTSPTRVSTVTKSTVSCPGTPPPVTSSTAITASQITLLSAVVTGDQNLRITYTQSVSQATYVTDAASNIIIQGSVGLSSLIPNSTEILPLSSFLGTVSAGRSVKLCTGNYSTCSNTVSVTSQ